MGPVWARDGLGAGLQDFQQLMRHSVRDILLVSSLFDLYLFENEGRLYEQIQDEYHGLQLSHSPEFARVSTGQEALAALRGGAHYDLVLTTLHIEDMTPLRLARILREEKISTPVVLLAYDSRELDDLVTHNDTSVFDRIFVWQADFRLLIAIIKDLEDRLNVEHDTSLFGVQCILLIEDSIHHASHFLPMLYSEVLRQSKGLISEGLSLAHRSLRMRARPKILLSSTWEQAWEYFSRYEQSIIGVISDVAFPRGGEVDPRAGLEFARRVRDRYFDVPVLLQSTDAEFASEANAAGALFLTKNSPDMEKDFRGILREYFAFGDFVFRTSDGQEVGRATDLKSLEEELHLVPDESLLYHAARNDFSNWLKARTEFRLAFSLRPRKISDYDSVAGLRADLIEQLHEHRSVRQRGLLTDFSPDTFDPESSFARLAGGSHGGKARGLAFVNALLSTYMVRSRFEGIEIGVPPGICIGTDVFDRFLDDNDLRGFARECTDDEEIMRRFVGARRFSSETISDLQEFLELLREPLAVRSSSVLEDSQFHPFAGVYQTYMLPNADADPHVRLQELLTAIKRVYASTFYRAAREYIKVTGLPAEDEKMGVIVQRLVGSRHQARFYPEISGVARSYNFYPMGPQKPEDGVVSLALGLGKTIVEGGVSVRFSPKHPDHLPQFVAKRGTLQCNQRNFYAIDMSTSWPTRSTVDEQVRSYTIDVAESDGAFAHVASTYCAENDALYDGIARVGTRIVTFAPILHDHAVPLPEAIDFLMELCSWAVGAPVEIEFAVNLSVTSGLPKELAILQVRPLALSRETAELTIDDVESERLICQSNQVLGHGAIANLRDLVVVDFDRFDRSKSHVAAREIARLNELLVDEGRDYILIGPGRWGTLDPWLGIPVKWDQIRGAKAIVEAPFRDITVDPSQGSHFFQNLTVFHVGYFTVRDGIRENFVDWGWLADQPAAHEADFVRHIRLHEAIVVKMNGHDRRGVILKP
ncbi:MAG: PEP/pyruvate-binding domain-containing protein [Thermoanaerobaculia bacterium]